MATAAAFICITVAAVIFESPKLLGWYIVALIVADYEF